MILDAYLRKLIASFFAVGPTLEIVLSSGFETYRTANLCALYCDRIVLPFDGCGFIIPDNPVTESSVGQTETGTVSEVYHTLSTELENGLSPFIKEGIMVKAEDSMSDNFEIFEAPFDELLDSIKESASQGLLPGYHPSLIESAQPVFQVHVSLLAAAALKASIRYEKPILSDNSICRDLIISALSEKGLRRFLDTSKQTTSALSYQVLNDFLPDIESAPADDILEVRNRFRNELGQFRNSMREFSSKVASQPWDSDFKNDIERVVETEIRPSAEELRRSLRQSNYGLVSKVFKNLKDARTYIPFVGSALGPLEPTIAALASAGLAGFDALQETISERQQIRDNNGLLFLLKAPAIVGKVSRR